MDTVCGHYFYILIQNIRTSYKRLSPEPLVAPNGCLKP